MAVIVPLCACRRALEIDTNNLKAFFFAGQCHLALGQYDEAVAKLTTAHTLAVENHRYFGDEITSAIRLAKRKRFEQLDEMRRQQEIDLQVFYKPFFRGGVVTDCDCIKLNPECLTEFTFKIYILIFTFNLPGPNQVFSNSPN